MGQCGQRQNKTMAVEGTPHVKRSTISNNNNTEANTNGTHVSSHQPFDGPLKDYGDPPNGRHTSGLDVPRKSSYLHQEQAEEDTAAYQKIPRPWASKFGEIEATLQDLHSVSQSPPPPPPPPPTALNHGPFSRWYNEPIAQGPYHNTDSVRTAPAVHHQDSSRRSAAGSNNAASMNSAERGSASRSR